MSDPSKILEKLAEINKTFTRLEINETQADKQQLIGKFTKSLAAVISEVCPDSREKSLAMTNLEQTQMWANKAVSHRS